MFEYAISDGDGTLIKYGVADVRDLDLMVVKFSDRTDKTATMIFAPISDDCQTGAME
tara:strand:+ start:11596 stop:11766 length:171 start_codon:yes stop_codon:yes gene_type:complete